MEDLFKVGVITSTHGIKGEVKVFPTTDDANRFKKLKKVILDTGKEKIDMEIAGVRFFKNMVILKFKGIDDINDVEKYRKAELYVTRENAVPLKKNEYYIADLIGMDVVSDEDEELINAVMPLDIIKETYNIRYSDHLKFSSDFNANAICDNKGKYLALYCRLLIKYPKDFIEAGLNLTIGYWYPGVDKSCVSYDYDSRYQFYENIGVANYSKSDIYRHFLTSDVRENVFEAWLWSPGVAIMIMFGLMLICLSQKSYMLLLSFMPTVFCWLSLMIATPSYCETRYVFYVFLNIPIWIVLILQKKIEN